MTDYWNWPANKGLRSTSQGGDDSLFAGIGSMGSEYLIRESVQNALDAINDETRTNERPVKISYEFFKSSSHKNTEKFFSQLWDMREHASLPERRLDVLREVSPTWLVISDENTTGIMGKTDDRESDIWKFICDWGKPKSGNTTGGAGVGTTALLNASKIKTLFAITQKEDTGEQVICGMSALNAVTYEGSMRDPYAFFLGSDIGESGLAEFHSDEVMNEFTESFRIDAFAGTGTKLIIPYPEEWLTAARMKAALIAHFLPALIEDKLIATVDTEHIDEPSINDFVSDIQDHLHNRTRAFVNHFKKDPQSFINFQIEYFQHKYNSEYKNLHEIRVDHAENLDSIDEADVSDFEKTKKLIVENIESGELTIIKVYFPIKVINKETDEIEIKDSYVTGAIKADPRGYGMELSYRNGMSIYKNKRFLNGRYHASVFAEEETLSDYLNNCETGSHVKWETTNDVKKKIKALFEEDEVMGIRSLCFNFFGAIGKWLNQSQEENNTDLLMDIFSVITPIGDDPSQKKGRKRDGKAKKKKQKPIPPAIPKPWKVQSLGMEGFSLKGMRDQNPDAFPLKIKIRTPYVDGRSNPEKRQITGEDFDFLNDDTDIEYNGCQVTISESEIILEANDENFEIKIGGYDFNRMPEVFVRRL